MTAVATGSGIRSRAATIRWEWVAFAGLLVFTGVVYLVNLSSSGWANAFYSAAVQAGSQNWESFFYGASDAANSITVDKPPASLWLMVASVKLFGLTPFAILLPEALMGVATVAVLYFIVRRHFPAWTALLAGFALAITPVAALMFRYNNPDALLVLLLTLSIWFTLRGIESGRIRWVILAGTMIGLGFLTKQLQAFLILPVLAGAYFAAAPISWQKRIGHLFAALGAVIVSAGWWVAVVQLVPASARPFIGGSQSNDFLELTFGYNGLGRLNGNETGSVTSGSGAHWGGTGLDRLFSGEIGAQFTWLMFAALAMTGVCFVLMRRLPRTSPQRATLVLLSGTMILTSLAFSLMAGIFHSYYTVAIAPALAGTFAIGAWMLWSRRDQLWSRIVMAVLTAGTSAWAWELLYRSDPWLPWLKWVVVALGAAGAALLLLPRPSLRVAAATVALTSVLLGPLAFTMATVAWGHHGAIVAAGPYGTGRVLNPATVANTAALTSHTAPLAQGAQNGGLLDSAVVSPALAAALSADSGSYTWVAAAIGSNMAAGYQLATGLPVMPIGGFNGSDPSPTLEQFEADVAAGRIHWYIVGNLGRSNGGSSQSALISRWVVTNFTAVSMGGERFYDLSKPLS